MLLVIIIVLITILGISGIIYLTKRKRCTCIGKPCGSEDGCGNKCCDPTKNQKCVNGKCCDNSCDGLTCGDKTGCGESCEKIMCGQDGICHNGSCCWQTTCEPGSCRMECGKPCPCPHEPGQPEPVCIDGECCTPPDCSTGICNNESKCGKKCTCNNDYCQGGCCQDGQCVYKDICNPPDKTFKGFLHNNWGKFCDSCLNCELKLPQWVEVNGVKSMAPISGTLSCESCKDNDNKFVSVDPIEIERKPQYYENDNGKIVPGPYDDNYCKEQGCDNCVCLNDADCQRWGCSKCVGMKCQ